MINPGEGCLSVWGVMTYDHLRYRVPRAVATIPLSRPDRLDALNLTIGVELLDALAGCAAALATSLAQGATMVPGMTRFALYSGWHEPPERPDIYQGRAVAESGSAAGRAEGQRVFLDKRPPVFRGD